MQNLKVTFLTAVLLFLTACGWHLRGQVDLPASLRILDVNLSAVDYTSQNAIKQSLLSNGVTINKDANYQLKVLKETQSKRTLAVTSNAKASEYELIQTLEFQLFNQQQQAVTEILVVTTFKTLLYDANAEIGKAQEEHNLRLEMKQANAYKILLRLKNIAFIPPKANK